MKTLFQRNKELEDKMISHTVIPPVTSSAMVEGLGCSNCKVLETKLEKCLKDKSSKPMTESDDTPLKSHITLLESRLAESLKEAKRHYESYMQMRN